MRIAGTVSCVALLILCGCESQEREYAIHATKGDPDRGRDAIRSYGCGTCHTIPGVRGADALVAPSLEHMASRNFIGGVLQNAPENMIKWLQGPPHVDPKTAMPDLHINEQDARDIASYLYTLR